MNAATIFARRRNPWSGAPLPVCPVASERSLTPAHFGFTADHIVDAARPKETKAMTNHLRELETAGQAVWLDYLHSKILEDGELARLIADDAVKGLTSNPSIFEKAIGDGDAYDRRVHEELKRGDSRPVALFERIAIADIQAAADIFRPIFERLGGKDGYVSLEVSPTLANDTEGTDRRGPPAVGARSDRPNLMIKVPGTTAGVPAIRQLIGEGINVNVTLLFARRRLRGGGRGVHGRPRGRSGARAAISAASPASPASSSAASTPRSTRRSMRG